MMQEQAIRSFYNAVNAHDVPKILSCFTDEGQFNDKSTEQIFRGRNEIRGMIEVWLKGLPDMKLQVSNIIGDGDIYCVELSLLGTHNGPLGGPGGEISATGKRVNVPSCDVIRLKNGKIQSLNCYFASTVLLGQIGAMPSASQAA